MNKLNNSNTNVLVVDDSIETIELIKRNLEAASFRIYIAHQVQSAIAILSSVNIDLVITDLKMPDQNGIQLVRHVSENYKHVGILVITGFPSIEGAVHSIKVGAEEYLVKPFTEDELFNAVEKVLSKTLSGRKSRNTTSEANTFGIIGASEPMLSVYQTISKAKTTNATVLITGESGTGKELVARALHYGSGIQSPFVPVNCGGIPDALLESELFGHVKGAFTGANETRAGFFQTAEGGTIFLDEIGNTSLAMQAKLLRVLQDKEFYMVGSKKPERANVRIVAATNVDLMELVKKGLFREDLYYRLFIITIHLPPLRQRGDDVELLTSYFLSKYAKELGKNEIRFTDKAMKALKVYDWPGNVRELQNLIHRLTILVEDDFIDIPDLPESFRYSAYQDRGTDRPLVEIEQEYIMKVLGTHRNNISRTARTLGIDRKTLREKIKRIRGNKTEE